MRRILAAASVMFILVVFGYMAQSSADNSSSTAAGRTLNEPAYSVSSDNAQAEFITGKNYENGNGVPVDRHEACRWYRKAFRHGHAGAATTLGKHYLQGQGVPRDLDKAFRLFYQASKSGDPEALYYLGRMLEDYIDTTASRREAIECYARSAEKKYADSQYILGLRYETGRGAPQDYSKAYFWYCLASKHGCEKAKIREREIRSTLSSNEIDEVDAQASAWLEEHSR